MTIKLGSVVTDSITGFKGIAVSRTEYIYGCSRVGVQPKEIKDGTPIAAQFFDELQLVENVETEGDKKIGGPGDIAPARSVPPQR
jgi:hypothetical protein